MNLLYFTHEREYGGSSRALVALIKELKKNNTIYVYVPFKNAKIVSELNKMNVQVLTCFYSWWQIPLNVSKLYKLLFRFAYIFNFISERFIINKIKALDIDIIHSNTSVIDIGAKVAKKLSIPHVWHFREFKKNNLEFIKSEERSYYFINKYGGHIIYISKAIEEFYSKNIRKDKTIQIYDEVSKDLIIENRQYKDRFDEIVFLLAGTLQKGKGQQYAVKAIGILKKKGYKNIKLYLAGGDPLQYGDYLKKLIFRYNINENVEYLGFVNDIKSLRRKVDVELLCSESEALGLVTIECMLAGNLIIGSNSGATSEIIQDKKTGYLYKFEDTDDLVEKMEEVINNPHNIKKIGMEAQRYAIEKFTSKKSICELLEYYKKIKKE